MATTDMRKALKQAALLRNRLETCLQAAAAPMTGRELADWPSIVEVTGTGLSGYGKLSVQLQQLVKKGYVDKIGKGTLTTYAWRQKRLAAAEPVPAPTLLPELRLRVNKSNHSLSFVFEGLSITIEVAQ